MGKTLLRFAFGLCLLMSPLVLLAQGNSNSSKASSSTHDQAVTATGCLMKGQEAGGYYLKDTSGKDWELMGRDLSNHVGHQVTVSGHEVQHSQEHEAKVENHEKAEAGGDQYADLHVSHLKMVSDKCQ